MECGVKVITHISQLNDLKYKQITKNFMHKLSFAVTRYDEIKNKQLVDEMIDFLLEQEIGFGKYKSKRIKEIAETDEGYFRWMISRWFNDAQADCLLRLKSMNKNPKKEVV